MRSDRRLAFLHIPKTAGTSLVHTIAALFRPERSETFLNIDPEFDYSRLRDKDLITGHFPYDVMATFPEADRFINFTILRNPFDRLVSHLRYCDRYNQEEMELERNQLPDDVKHTVARLASVDFDSAASLSRFVAELDGWSRVAFLNCQVRFLSTPRAPAWQTSEDLTRKAIDTLSAFHLFGLAEEMCATVKRLSALLAVTPPSVVARSNVNNCVRDIDVSRQSIRDALITLVHEDLRLYAVAERRFHGLEQPRKWP